MTCASLIVTQVVMISRVVFLMNNCMTNILIVCLTFFIKINDAKWMKKALKRAWENAEEGRAVKVGYLMTCSVNIIAY